MMRNKLNMLCYGSGCGCAIHHCHTHNPPVIKGRGATRFVVNHTIKDFPVYGAAARAAVAMVSELRAHAAADVIELFVETLVLKTTPILDSGLVKRLYGPL
ncbi:hypothetical protein TNCV_3700951 [Trichonephila clavipes]|nr:hypothetical protein TNCV_3700951 [Trichonephila clavipes]